MCRHGDSGNVSLRGKSKFDLRILLSSNQTESRVSGIAMVKYPIDGSVDMSDPGNIGIVTQPNLRSKPRGAILPDSEITANRPNPMTSIQNKLLNQAAISPHAITSVTHPAFRRHGLKKLPMIQGASTGLGSLDFSGIGPRGLLRSR